MAEKRQAVVVRPFTRREFMRRMGIAGAVLPAGALLAGCPAGDPEVADEVDPDDIGGVLNYWSWEGYDLLDQTEQWRDEHGVDMRSGYVGGHEDIHTRVLSPAGEDIDLITYYHGWADHYRRLEVVSPIQPEEVPNLEHVMPFFRDAEWFRNEDGTYSGIPFTWGAICLNYRPDLVEAPPQRWQDLLEPEFRGRVAMVDDMNGNMVCAALVLGYEPERMTESQLDDVQDWLIQMKQQAVAISPSFGDVNSLLIAGDASAAFMGWAALNVWAADAGVELECVVPEEGSLTFVDAYAIPPDAPNRATALGFINETITADVQLEQAEFLSAGVVRDDVIDDLPEELRAIYPYDDLDSFFERAGLYDVAPLESDEYVTLDDWVRAWEAVKAT
jgi:spermidine/putrescine transport system substrate-binding protein